MGGIDGIGGIEEHSVAILTLRDLDDALVHLLQLRAARSGRSVEREALEILRAALTTGEAEADLGSKIRARFAALGDIVLPIPARDAEPPRATPAVVRRGGRRPARPGRPQR